MDQVFQLKADEGLKIQLFEYFQEMGGLLKGEEAIECMEKALDLAVELYGVTDFKVVACKLSMANMLD